LQGTSGAGVTAKIYQPLIDYLRARFRGDLLRKSTSSSPAFETCVPCEFKKIAAAAARDSQSKDQPPRLLEKVLRA
jgi:hypothetical protein